MMIKAVSGGAKYVVAEIVAVSFTAMWIAWALVKVIMGAS